MSKSHVISWQKTLNRLLPSALLHVDGEFGPKTLMASEQLALSAGAGDKPASETSAASTGQRSFGSAIVGWMLDEASIYAKKVVERSRVAQYLSGCLRGGKNIGGWLQDTNDQLKHPFCAAARGFAERQVALMGDQLPIWRAGALEIWKDGVLAGRTINLYEVTALGVLPQPGDVAFYLDTIKNDGSGHIRTVIEAHPTYYRGVGANENGGRWGVDAAGRKYTDESKVDGQRRVKLVGFVRC